MSAEPRGGAGGSSQALFAGKYRLVRMLGKGAMGEVWLADEEGPRNFSRRVAVKRLLSATDLSEYATESFIAEAQVIARLDHPNIVRLIELGSAEGGLYLVLDFVDGPALDKLLKKGGALSPYAVAYVGREVARALESVHSLCDDAGNNYGVVHRDVTPSNILLSRDGRVRLTDFGVARISGLGGDKTEAGVFKGKLPYMPPEQARGEPFDGRADIFSLAITLFEAMIGRRLRKAETQAQLIMMVASEPVPRVREVFPEAHANLATAIDHATELDPRRRFTTAGEFAMYLDEVLRSFGAGAERAAVDEIKNRVAAYVGVPPPNATGTYPSAAAPPPAQNDWAVPLTSRSQVSRSQVSSGRSGPAASPGHTSTPPSASRISEGSTYLAGTGSSVASIHAMSAPPARSRTPVIVAVSLAVGVLAAGVSFVVLRANHDPEKVVQGSEDASAKPVESAAAASASVSASATAEAVASAAPEVPAEPSGAKTTEARATGPAVPVRSGGSGPSRGTGPAPSQSAATEEASGPGTLQVVVLPWADVSVDGRSVGTTPIAPVSLPPGPHSVTLRNSELGVSRTVGATVKSGQSTLLRIDLKRAE